jgi:hypothetical protein
MRTKCVHTITTYLINLPLGNFLARLGGAEQYVEPQRSSVESGLLRNKSQLLAIVLNAEGSNVLFVN